MKNIFASTAKQIERHGKLQNPNQFTFYSYTNYYGVKMCAIGHMDAMPVNYGRIIFTGTIAEVKARYNQTI